jgi:hypothetical protein
MLGTFRRALPVIRILWGALTLSTVLLVVVSVIVQQDPQAALQPGQLPVLAVLALGSAVASFVLPARMAAKAPLKRPEIVEGAPGRFAHAEDAARHALGRGQTGFILSMALSEVVSMVGLVLHMFGAPLAISSPFFVAGTLLAVLHFPRLPRLVAPYERACGAKFTEQDLS